MDLDLMDLVYDTVPPMNRQLCDGLAVSHLDGALHYIDNILRSAGDTMPRGLTYHGIKRLSPIEELSIATNSRSGAKPNWDIATSDVYMTELHFKFEGVDIMKYLYLPFCRDGGIIVIRGSVFSINPVLADKAISIGEDSIFIRIAKARMVFKTLKHHILANNVRRTPTISYSWLHNRNRKLYKNTVVKMTTTLAHYMFCKMGVKATFKRFLGVDIQIGVNFSEKDYPSDKWVVVKTTRLIPKGYLGKQYRHSNINLAIPLCDFDTVSESMLGAFFYVVDHFPTEIQAEYIDGSESELLMWRIALGHIIGGNTGGEGAILNGVNAHIDSLDGCVDSLAKEDLAKGEVYVEDIYDILWYVISFVGYSTNTNSDNISNIGNKTLLVLRYALQDINDGLFRMLYLLKNKESKRPLTFKQVNITVKNKPNRETVLRMTMYGEVTPVNTSSDNKVLSITTNVTPQTDSGVGTRENVTTNDPSKFLHTSIAEVGSYLTLPGREATGRGKLNMWVKLSADGSFIPDPKHKELIARTAEMIKR